MPLNRRTVILSLGYLKLVLINLLELGFLISGFFMLANSMDLDWSSLAIPIATVAVLVVDTVFCVVLLAGGHKRSRSVLRVYFWLAIFGVVVAILRAGYVVASIAAAGYAHYAGIFWFHFVAIAIQITLLVLVRREIRSIETTARHPSLLSTAHQGTLREPLL